MNWTTACACWNKGGSETACKRTWLASPPNTRIAAEWATRFRAQSQRSGRTLDLGDVLIAGTAKANGLHVATRNVANFHYINIDVTNPWVAS